jgi:hypothetical protein
MATKDRFDPDHPLQFFLCDGEPEQGLGNGRAVISLRFAIASISVAAAIATGISILSAGNPVTLFADVTASLADKSAPQPTAASASIIQPVVIQSTADAEALPLTAQDVPTREIEPGSLTKMEADGEPASQIKKVTDEEPANQTQKVTDEEPGSQTQKITDEASSETLFRDEEDGRGLAKPVQNDPAPVAKNASTSVRPTQKNRMGPTTRNANAEMIGHVRERRANVRRRNERIQAGPLIDGAGRPLY